MRSAAVRWLLDADPSIRWQALRDLTAASAHEIAAERAKVATEGAGARLLALQGDDGCWGGTAWNRGWDSTMHVLTLLREMGLDPAGEHAQRALTLVREHVTWRGCGPPEVHANRFFAGEVEPCINGQVAAAGAYFGQDVGGIVDRLLAEQLADGGWNCEAENGSTRSSFNTTICVLEALLDYERSVGGDAEVMQARGRGQDYLLERRLLRRKSTGELIERDRKSGASWQRFAFPTWWHYDVLRALDYLRRAGVAPDERVAEAVDLVAAKRDAQGRWPLETQHAGRMPVAIDDGEGRPSRWNTLRALRVLDWYSTRGNAPARLRGMTHRIVPGDLDDARVRALVEHHLTAARVSACNHALNVTQLKAPQVQFWAAWDGERLLGVGALQRLSADHGEIKSMHTASDQRRRGIGSAMLLHIITAARAAGMRRLSLETGSWDYFAAARALYQKHGFIECGPFGEYAPDPLSVFMSREL